MPGLAEADDVDPSHAHDAGPVARAEVGAGRVPFGDRDTFLVGAAHAARYAPVELEVAQRDTRPRGAHLARLEGGGGAGGGASRTGGMRAGFQSERARARDVTQELAEVARSVGSGVVGVRVRLANVAADGVLITLQDARRAGVAGGRERGRVTNWRWEVGSGGGAGDRAFAYDNICWQDGRRCMK